MKKLTFLCLIGLLYANTVSAQNDGKQVEWITNLTNESYIRTNYHPTKTTRIVCTANIAQSSNYVFQTIFGCGFADRVQTFSFFSRGGNTRDDAYALAITGRDKFTDVPAIRGIKAQYELDGAAGTATIYDAEGTTLVGPVNVGTQSANCEADLIIFAETDQPARKINHIQAAGMAFYGMKVYENNVLVKDYVPWILADGTIGVKDLIGNEFFRGEGSFTAPVADEEGVQLDWINNTGRTWIWTEYCPTYNTRTIATADISTTSDGYHTVFGTGYSDGVQQYAIFSIGGGKTLVTSGKDGMQHFDRALRGQKYQYELNAYDGVATVYGADGNTVKQINLNTQMNANCVTPLIIYAESDQVCRKINHHQEAGMKLYGMKIYDRDDYEDEFLARDFVPWMNKYGKIGVRDLKTGRFHIGMNQVFTCQRTISLTNGYATATMPVACEIQGSDVKAYKAVQKASNYVKLEDIGTSIPANTGVVLYGEGATSVTLVPSNAALESPADNLMQPWLATDILEQTTDDGTNYLLVVDGNGMAFAPTSGKEDLKTGNSYLHLSGNAESKIYVGFDDNPTGINTINGNGNGNSTVYDLQGRKMADNQRSLSRSGESKPSSPKGVYIVNGKKIVIK